MVSPVAASLMSPTSAGTVQPTCVSARESCLNNRPASLSPGSRETHAARGFRVAASHWETRVVLPYPAGAETSVTGSCVASSSFPIRRARSTQSPRVGGR